MKLHLPPNNMTIHDLDTMDEVGKKELLFRCCGSASWVKKMLSIFPVEDLVELLNAAEEKWFECTEDDWKEAFLHHPKIGDTKSLEKKFASTAGWAATEQSGVNTGEADIIQKLAAGNVDYEQKFGYIFIVCATGKSAEEMLHILEIRLENEPAEEMKIAAEEQNQITQIRIEKLFA